MNKYLVTLPASEVDLVDEAVVNLKPHIGEDGGFYAASFMDEYNFDYLTVEDMKVITEALISITAHLRAK